MFRTYDRIREVTTDTGIGSVSLAAYGPNYLRFSDVFLVNTKFPYVIAGDNSFECGIGHLDNFGSLNRDTILSSSDFINNSGNITFNRINFTTGNKDVFVSSSSVLSPTISTSPTNGYAATQFLIYYLNEDSNNWEWQLMPLSGIGTFLKPLPDFYDNTVLYTNNSGEINQDVFFTYDPGALKLSVGGDIEAGNLIKAKYKMFSIPHPSKENMILNHCSLEGPEAGIYFRKTIETSDGIIKIELPDYFTSLSKNISVFISPNKPSKIHWEQNDNLIIIKNSNLFKKKIIYNILIIAQRKDVVFEIEEKHA